MPPEHAGTEFTFRVQFSEDPAVSYKVLKKGSFVVIGGTITRARRVNGKHDLREIHVVPWGVGDVRMTLAGERACGTWGAICTAGGKKLSTTLKATVKGPAGDLGGGREGRGGGRGHARLRGEPEPGRRSAR